MKQYAKETQKKRETNAKRRQGPFNQTNTGCLFGGTVWAGVLILILGTAALAQTPAANSVAAKEKTNGDVEVIETEINFDAMQTNKSGTTVLSQKNPSSTTITIKPSADLSKPSAQGSGFLYAPKSTENELRELQVIQINDSLRTLIEENEKLKT